MKKILYVDMIFPSTTGTFVYNEIKALKTHGISVETVSIASPNKNSISSEAIIYYDTTMYLDRVCFIFKILSNLRLFLCRPLKWVQLLFMALREREVKGLRDRMRILYHFFLASYLVFQIKNRNFDQIHSPFLTGSATIALFLSQFLDIPFSFTMHASNIFVDPIMLGSKLRLCRNAITISEYNKKFLIDKYGTYLKTKLQVIHCGVDVRNFEPPKCEKPEPPIILSVGQLTRRKGFAYLLEAISILEKRGLAFRSVIVGDGEDASDLNDLALKLNLCEVVNFVGRQDQLTIKQFLSKATVFALPSIVTPAGGREGIPVALMEAMSMEVPVVSTDTVGIPELIEHLKTGLLVPEKNSLDLADAIEYLLKNKQAAIEIGMAGRVKVQQDFNLADTPTRFVNLLS